MTVAGQPRIEAAQFVLPCADLDATLRFFTELLGFRIDSVFPADDPAIAEISGHGSRVRLRRGADGPSGHIRLLSAEPDTLADGKRELTAPNGTRIEIVPAEPLLDIPPAQQSLAIMRLGDDADWGVGRAGMRYRDLIPDRQAGYIIASHIRIPDAGPVPDYVHFHKVRFQMIYCYKGWVRVVYEDQGAPFVLEAGDCVLQPPEIRHRVLESGGGLEVIEIGCPAEHMTCVDHALALPTETARPDRDFSGQRFVRHQSRLAQWQPWRISGFAFRDTGIGGATGGIADARVARRTGTIDERPTRHDADIQFHFILQGSLNLGIGDGERHNLAAGDSFLVPAKVDHALTGCSDDLELLEVTMPVGA